MSYIEVKFNNEVFHGWKCENKRTHCVRNVYLTKDDILDVTFGMVICSIIVDVRPTPDCFQFTFEI